MNIVLDLDNTLISAVEYDEYDVEKNREKSQLFESFDVLDQFIVFKRPYVDEFLDFLFDNCQNVCVWSAGSKDYVLTIVNELFLKKNRIPKCVFFLYHCNLSEEHHKGLKDLDMLCECMDFEKEKTFIVDDLDHVIDLNNQNSFHVEEFEFVNENSENDKDLLRIKELIKQQL